MGNGDFGFENMKLSVILAGIGSAALVVTIYHCLVWCHLRLVNRSQSPPQRQTQQASQELAIHEDTTAELIPAHKYQKGMGLVGHDETCAVCLSQFEEGEELKILPECLHSYHAPCIDMWLYSHSSCPMCRADATPSSSQIVHHHHSSEAGPSPPDSGSMRLDSGMLHDMVQSR